ARAPRRGPACRSRGPRDPPAPHRAAAPPQLRRARRAGRGPPLPPRGPGPGRGRARTRLVGQRPGADRRRRADDLPVRRDLAVPGGRTLPPAGRGAHRPCLGPGARRRRRGPRRDHEDLPGHLPLRDRGAGPLLDGLHPRPRREVRGHPVRGPPRLARLPVPGAAGDPAGPALRRGDRGRRRAPATAAALPSIVRGEQTVVVGDPLEYGGDSAPSLLDDMLRIAPHVEILRDPHPATEGLRGFAQRRALVGEVTAVPSPIAPEQDRLVMVEHGRGMVPEGMEYVESTEAELRRVTDLVIEHARTRPERSLAVLTFTEDHARRLMERIMNTVSVIPELRDYFDPGAKEVFTVLPADQATAVVRDDIIVSVGFGKTPHGRLLHRFGPLSEAGGRKALATVITRARGRTTVVSSIGVQDLDHARLRSDGARDLRAMLWVLQGGPDVPVVPHV